MTLLKSQLSNFSCTKHLFHFRFQNSKITSSPHLKLAPERQTSFVTGVWGDHFWLLSFHPSFFVTWDFCCNSSFSLTSAFKILFYWKVRHSLDIYWSPASVCLLYELFIIGCERPPGRHYPQTFSLMDSWQKVRSLMYKVTEAGRESTQLWCMYVSSQLEAGPLRLISDLASDGVNVLMFMCTLSHFVRRRTARDRSAKTNESTYVCMCSCYSGRSCVLYIKQREAGESTCECIGLQEKSESTLRSRTLHNCRLRVAHFISRWLAAVFFFLFFLSLFVNKRNIFLHFPSLIFLTRVFFSFFRRRVVQKCCQGCCLVMFETRLKSLMRCLIWLCLCLEGVEYDLSDCNNKF